jgi:hypothetical protein
MSERRWFYILCLVLGLSARQTGSPAAISRQTKTSKCSGFDLVYSKFNPDNSNLVASFITNRWFPFTGSISKETSGEVRPKTRSFDFESFKSDATNPIQEIVSPGGSVLRRIGGQITVNGQPYGSLIDASLFAWLDDTTYVVVSGKSEWQDGGLPFFNPIWEPRFLWTQPFNNPRPRLRIERIVPDPESRDRVLWTGPTLSVSAPQRIINIGGVASLIYSTVNGTMPGLPPRKGRDVPTPPQTRIVDLNGQNDRPYTDHPEYEFGLGELDGRFLVNGVQTTAGEIADARTIQNFNFRGANGEYTLPETDVADVLWLVDRSGAATVLDQTPHSGKDLIVGRAWGSRSPSGRSVAIAFDEKVVIINRTTRKGTTLRLPAVVTGFGSPRYSLTWVHNGLAIVGRYGVAFVSPDFRMFAAPIAPENATDRLPEVNAAAPFGKTCPSKAPPL